MTTARPLVRQLTSRDNPAFKEIAGIASSARDRRKARASFIEGIHLCQAYLQRHGEPLVVVHTAGALDDPEAAPLARAQAARRFELSDPLFREISQLEQGAGIAYVVRTPEPELPERLDADAVYLDRIQDPGPVGALLRTCAAAGIGRVITAPGTAFCWSPKVLRAGMGAHFALDLHESVPFEVLRPALAVPVRATLGEGAVSLYRADLSGPGLWVFGNEGGGIDAAIAARAEQRIRIPQTAAVESLNVAHAAAICLFEQRRQRGALE